MRNLFYYMFILSFLLNLAQLGAVLNLTALYNNGGKMPVLTESKYSNPTHFSYQDKDEIELWFLTDIISIRNSVFSIGDFLIIFSGITISYYSVIFIKDRIKRYYFS